jgi:DNA gyrase/topoisomerase IV subunit B/DNA gyrase/topoisomerase IV subunit A/intein/homing endonuclease
MNYNEDKKQKESYYGASQIQVLGDIEAVRKRPGMYIGSTGEQGIHHLVWEVIDNSIDEAVAGYGKKITVSLSPDKKVITVSDEGRGIPLEIHSKTKKSTLETVFTVLHSGGKFDHQIYQTSGGLHGVGVTAVNALSSFLKVKVKRDKKIAIQYFEKGDSKLLEILDFDSNETGTSVQFTPDKEIFVDFTEFDSEAIKNRMKELAYLNPDLTLVFSEDYEEVDNEELTGELLTNSVVYHYPAGLSSWIQDLNKNDYLEGTIIFQDEWKNNRNDDNFFHLLLAFQYNKTHKTITRSFCNNVKTEDGGTHVSGFEVGLLTVYREIIKEKFSNLKIGITKDDALEGLSTIISVRIKNPQFVGQTKDKLSNEEVRRFTKEAVYDLVQKFLKNNNDVSEIIIQKIINSASIRAKSEEHLNFLRDAKQNFVLPGKLSDCISKDPENNEILFVEGESASGSVKNARYVNIQAVLSLKGKVTNAEKMKKTKVFGNDEIKNLINALGLIVTDVFKGEVKDIRYGKIIIMTDADIDGAHIALLLATFFFKFLPSLIEKRNIFLAVPPLYRLQSSKKDPIYFFNDEELNEYKKSNSLKNDNIQRFKGLSEMSPQQLRETIMNPEERILHELFFSNLQEAERQINLLMGIKSDERKLLLESGEHRGVKLIVSPENKVEISQFALVNFLLYAYMVIEGRALPHVNDGLKPVQRRILYTLYQLNILPNKPFKKSAKVIGEVMGKYHPHGDSSIYQAMVKMAQDFNYRYPLIEGQGNFGSIDGDEAGAYRYCFVGDTRVMTDMGLVRISDIPKINGLDKMPEVMEISSMVNSIGTSQKATKWLYSGVQNVLEITTEKGYKVVCTPNEPFYILNENLEFEWKEADKFLIGQSLSLNTVNQVNIPSEKNLEFSDYLGRGKDLQVPSRMSKDLAKFLGYIVSDGSLRLNKTSLEFGSSDKLIHNDFISISKVLFPDAKIKTRVVEPTEGRQINSTVTHYYVSINSSKIVQFLNLIGAESVLAPQKKIPNIIFQSSAEEVSSFISAYYEGDGSVNIGETQCITLLSTSYELLGDMKLLLLNYFGIISNKILINKADGNNTLYSISITSGEEIVKFRSQINFISKRKKEEIDKAIIHDGESGSFARNLIPSLSEFITKYFNERNISPKYISDDFGISVLKQEVFPLVLLSKFRQIKTKVKLIQYLEKWSDDSRKRFSILYNKLSSILNTDYYFDKIVSIKLLDEQHPVYDLTVESTNAFVANGFVAHNTEVRLTHYGMHVLGEIDLGTVDWKSNYDETESEPEILPSLLPNLLLNGSSGVAVGMSTNIPPHNIKEIIDALILMANNPLVETSELIQIVKGPDFPTGGIIVNGKELEQIYENGEGTIYVRSRVRIEDNVIFVTEIPFKVNKVELIKDIDSLIKRKKVEGLRSVVDYSNLEGIDIRIKFEKWCEPGIILNQLYKKTRLQSTFSVKLRSLEEGKPKIFNLKETIQSFISKKIKDIGRRSVYLSTKNRKELDNASTQLFIINNYQQIADIVKSSENEKIRDENLKKKFSIEQEKINQILDTPSNFRQFSVERVARLEEKISNLNKEQANLLEIIGNEESRRKYLINELETLRDKYATDKRRTDILYSSRFVTEKQLVVKKDELIILNISEERKIDISTGKQDKKLHSFINVYNPGCLNGTNSPSVGKEINKIARGIENKKIIRTNTHADLWCFSNLGKIYIIPVYSLPLQQGKKYGTNLRESGILKLVENEIITNIIAVEDKYLETTNDKYLVILTKKGKIKKISLDHIKNVFVSGKKVVNIARFEDEICQICFTSGEDQVIIFTKEGRYKYLDEKLIKIRGRTSYGNTGIKVRGNNYDETVGLLVIKKEFDRSKLLILGVTGDNLGRKTPLEKIKLSKKCGGVGQQVYKTQHKLLKDKKERWCNIHDKMISNHKTTNCCDKSKGISSYVSCSVFKKIQKAIKECLDCQSKYLIKRNPLVQIGLLNTLEDNFYMYVLAGKFVSFYNKNDFIYSSKSKKKSLYRAKDDTIISDLFITSKIDEDYSFVDEEENEN